MLCEGWAVLLLVLLMLDPPHVALPFYPADEPLPVGDVAYTSAILSRGAVHCTQITALFISA